MSGGVVVGSGSTSLTFSLSVTLSTSTSNTETYSTADSRSVNAGVSVNHGEAGFIEAIVYQTTADIPYSSAIVVDGDLVDNVSGKRRASDMLTIAERTLPFTGSVRATGMSDAHVANNGPAVPFKCEAGDGTYVSSPTYRTLPAADLSNEFL